MEEDFYGILQVHPRASQQVIKAAYRALIAEIHPDMGKSGIRARKVNEAYEVLSDPVKRARYDQEREELEGSLIQNYRILAPIAEGGFGKTYKGEHVLAGELVCIKHCSRVSREDEKILIGEAKAIWDLRHYSLPVMRDLIKLDDGSLALVMSYIPGPTLEQIVKKVGRLDAEHVAWIAERVINALKYLHFHGVVHGDVKPQNIIVQPESHTVVLVDFGLAMVKPSRGDINKGFTPLFAPPEEITGSPLVPESDFYSLGLTMIYALGGNTDCVERRQVPRDVPEPLCAFIRRLIVHDVLGRPNWQREDLFDSIQKVRVEAFGRVRSDMKPIPGL